MTTLALTDPPVLTHPDAAAACGGDEDLGWHGRVVWREEHVKDEAAATVGCVLRAWQQKKQGPNSHDTHSESAVDIPPCMVHGLHSGQLVAAGPLLNATQTTNPTAC